MITPIISAKVIEQIIPNLAPFKTRSYWRAPKFCPTNVVSAIVKLVIGKNACARLVNIKNQDTVTKILDMVPDILDRFGKKDKEEKIDDKEAVDAAFPAEQ